METKYDPSLRDLSFDPTRALSVVRSLENQGAKGKDLEGYFGGFSTPSKMPGLSFNLPALVTCRLGAILNRRKGSVCSGCYATKGRYAFPSTQAALARRLRCLTGDPEVWAAALALRLSTYKGERAKWFRFHDSGDIVSVGHLRAIAWIARRCPNTRFWLPTREIGIVSEYLRTYSTPPNLTIRLSGAMIDRDPVRLSGSPPVTYSAVHSGAAPEGYRTCPAPKQGGKCGECRSCWDRSALVSYHVH